MASVFVYHVVGDLTVAKPELVEFLETETVEAAIKAIGESTESGIPVWKRKKGNVVENSEMRQQRFVGILNPLDIVAFLGRMEDQEKALMTPVSEIVVPDKSLLKEVDPATRLVDALEMMKQGVKRLLVPKSVPWRGFSKKFSVLYNGRWLKNTDSSSTSLLPTSLPSTSTTTTTTAATARINKFCCLSREDVVRFLINCLGALAPIPLSSISTLGAINPDYCFIPSSSPAIEAINKRPHDPSAIAIVDVTLEGQHKIIGEISACKLWSCDYLATSYALAHLSAGQFVMGVEDNMTMRSNDDVAADPNVNGSVKLRQFNSRSLGFYSNSIISPTAGAARSMYRGRSVPLTCKPASSLAAVMAQMLSHRATHVWVTEGENDDVLVGVVGYADILRAVTLPPPAVVPE